MPRVERVGATTREKCFDRKSSQERHAIKTESMPEDVNLHSFVSNKIECKPQRIQRPSGARTPATHSSQSAGMAKSSFAPRGGLEARGIVVVPQRVRLPPFTPLGQQSAGVNCPPSHPRGRSRAILSMCSPVTTTRRCWC